MAKSNNSKSKTTSTKTKSTQTTAPKVQQEDTAAIRQQQLDQLNTQYWQVNNYLQQLRNQLAEKEALLQKCTDCYDQLIISKNSLVTILEDAYSRISSQLQSGDRAKVLNRSYDTIKAKLDGPKIANAVDEIDGEKGKLLRRIDELDGEIEWLRGEISRQEGQLWQINQQRGELYG